MDLQSKALKEEINNYKEKLYDLLKTHRLIDEPVIICSQKLDVLIVKSEMCTNHYVS